MKINIVKIFTISAYFLAVSNLSAQQASNYDYKEAFKEPFYTYNGNEFRSASGQPGTKYWQNHANYVLNITLDDTQNLFTGSAEVQYTNNSPDELKFIWFQLDQNLFKRIPRKCNDSA